MIEYFSNPQSNCTPLSQARAPRMSLCYRRQLSLSAICSHYWFIYHLFTLSVHHPSKVGEKCHHQIWFLYFHVFFLSPFFSGSSFSIANNHSLALIASFINCVTRVKICLERQILLPQTSDNVTALCGISRTAADPGIQIALSEVFDSVLRVTVILACQFWHFS